MQLGLSFIPEKTQKNYGLPPYPLATLLRAKTEITHPHQSNCRLTGDLCVRKNPS